MVDWKSTTPPPVSIVVGLSRYTVRPIHIGVAPIVYKTIVIRLNTTALVVTGDYARGAAIEHTLQADVIMYNGS